jgi:hypothetical protein
VVVHAATQLSDAGWVNNLVERFSCVGCCVIFLIVFHLYVVVFVVSWFFWYEGRA